MVIRTQVYSQFTSQQRFGDAEASEVHLQAWQKVLSSRLSVIPQVDLKTHVGTLLDRVIDSTRTHCGLLASTGRKPLYRRTPTRISAAFNVFEPLTPEMLDLFSAVSELAKFDASMFDALPRLRELTLQAFVARMPESLSDEHMLYALYHVRNATCALCGRFHGDPRIAALTEVPLKMQSVMTVHRQCTQNLALRDFEILIGTAYQVRPVRLHFDDG